MPRTARRSVAWPTRANLIVIDANSFELHDKATGALIQLTDPGAAATHLLSFISAVKSFNPTTAVNSSLDTIEIANHGLKDGDQVVYATDPTKINAKSRVFDIDAIDSTNDTVHIAGHGFGQRLRSRHGNTAIGG